MSSLDTFLKDARDRLEKATPGPWKCEFDGNAYEFGTADEVIGKVFMGKDERENARLIAHAPADLSKALSIIEELRGALEKIRGSEAEPVEIAHSALSRVETLSGKE